MVESIVVVELGRSVYVACVVAEVRQYWVVDGEDVSATSAIGLREELVGVA